MRREDTHVCNLQYHVNRLMFADACMIQVQGNALRCYCLSPVLHKAGCVPLIVCTRRPWPGGVTELLKVKQQGERRIEILTQEFLARASAG